jgi:hypothetical protein
MCHRLREAELSEVVSRPAEILAARFATDGLAAHIAERTAEECWPQALVTTGYFPTGYFPTGYLPGSLPIGALPTVATGGGSLRGKSAADATPAKANVATTANTSFVMTKILSLPPEGSFQVRTVNNI